MSWKSFGNNKRVTSRMSDVWGLSVTMATNIWASNASLSNCRISGRTCLNNSEAVPGPPPFRMAINERHVKIDGQEVDARGL